ARDGRRSRRGVRGVQEVHGLARAQEEEGGREEVAAARQDGPRTGPACRRAPRITAGPFDVRSVRAVRDRSRRGTCAHWRTTMFSESMNRPTGEDIVLMTCATWPGCMIVLGSSSGARVLRSAVAVRPGDRHTTRVP